MNGDQVNHLSSGRRRWSLCWLAIAALALGLTAWGGAALQSYNSTISRYGWIAFAIGVLGILAVASNAVARRMSRFVHRRYFQFGLRAVFVFVTAFAIWLGLEIKYVQNRQAWLRSNQALLEPVYPTSTSAGRTVITFYAHPTQKHFPFWRRWLGDAPVERITFPDRRNNRNLAQWLFPEAQLSQIEKLAR